MSDEGVFKKGRFSVSLSGDELFISYRGAIVRVPCEGFLGMQYDENLSVIEIEYGKEGKTYLVKIKVSGDGKKESEDLAPLIFSALSKYFNEKRQRNDDPDEKESFDEIPEVKVMVKENSDEEYKECKDIDKQNDFLADAINDDYKETNKNDFVKNEQKKVKNGASWERIEKRRVVQRKKKVPVKKKDFWNTFFDKYDIYIIGAGTMSAIIIVLFVASKLIGLA